MTSSLDELDDELLLELLSEGEGEGSRFLDAFFFLAGGAFRERLRDRFFFFF